MCPPGPGLNDIGIDDALREVDLDIAIGGGLTTGRIVSFSWEVGHLSMVVPASLGSVCLVDQQMPAP